MITLALIALAQTPMNLNQQALMVKSGGVSISPVRAITVNCGTNVTCTQTGSTWNLSASGGGGGGGNAVEVSVDFTASAYPVLAATVTGQTWVTASSKIICEPFATDAAAPYWQHSQPPSPLTHFARVARPVARVAARRLPQRPSLMPSRWAARGNRSFCTPFRPLGGLTWQTTASEISPTQKRVFQSSRFLRSKRNE